MARKKKDKEKMSDESAKKDDAESSKEGDIEKEKEKEQDIKLLEGEEQKILEYHDLDDLIAKYKKLQESNTTDKELLTKHQKEADSWKGKHMRLQAEFENAQKRWNKSRQNLRKEYTGLALKSFLPLYDSFRKALDEGEEENTVLKQFYDQFMSTLKFYKAEPIKVKINDLFDYTYHEALSSIEKDDLPNNSIIEIIQDGWKMDKDVLRYTKVIISRIPPPPKPEPEPEPESEPELKTPLENKDKDETEMVEGDEETKNKDIDEPKEKKGESAEKNNLNYYS